MSTVTVTVPASTANLGPGFDCLGAALTLYNQFKFIANPSIKPPVSITVMGSEAQGVDTSEKNLAFQAFLKVYQHLDRTPPPVRLEIMLEVPLARGLGSSATAIVGGLVAANQLAGEPLDRVELMKLAIAIEGHPDNVVPALLGGCRLAAGGEAWAICEIPWHESVVPIVAIPDFELSTEQARRVLPAQYSRADAIFNTAHLGLLVRALETGRGDWLRVAMQDRIHQPYRQTLIPGYEAVRAAALGAGAYGIVISGAGPTLIALADTAKAVSVATAMAEAWQVQGITAQQKVLQIDAHGARSAVDSVSLSS